MAAVRMTVSRFDAMMKEIYTDGHVDSLAKKNRPLLMWMPRKDDFYGDALVSPVMYEDPQSAGLASLSTAITNAETTKQTKFVLTDSDRIAAYGVVQITAASIMASSKDVGAFVRAKKAQIDGMIRQMGKQLHLSLYRGGSGSLGQISSLTADSPSAGKTTIVLTNKSDIYSIGEGQVLVVSADDGGGSVKQDSSTDNTAKVESLDHDAGSFVVDVDVVNDYTAAWAADDFLFPQSNYDAVITGLAGWLPLTAPTSSDSFFSVNRSTNVAALAGHRVDKSGRTILENVHELAMKIHEFGGEPDTLFINPRAGLQLQEQVGAKVERSDGGRARVGFSGFTLVNTMGPEINVIFDMGCPPNRMYLLQKDTWVYSHMGPVPHIVRDDGRDSLRSYDGSYDGIEIRSRAFGNLRCKVPGFNGVGSVATS